MIIQIYQNQKLNFPSCSKKQPCLSADTASFRGVRRESPMGDSFKNCPHPGGQNRLPVGRLGYEPNPNIL
jgi:hypothetical protein